MSISTADIKVRDVLLGPDQIPIAPPTTLLKQALEMMNKHRLGVVCITNDDNHLLGIFTDGDVRRMLLKEQKPFPALFVDDIIIHATKNPTTIDPAAALDEALALMEEKEIWDLPVVNADTNIFVGLLHLHPAIKAVMEM